MKKKREAALKKAIILLLELGQPAKAIARSLGIGYHTVLRAHPERFATARRRVATPS